jgi:predicted dehydrogenase
MWFESFPAALQRQCVMTWSLDRRNFLTAAAAASSAALLGAAPTGALNQRRVAVGCVGVGNRGETNCIVMAGQEMLALCDVDEKFLNPMLDRFPTAKPFTDWREMLDKASLEAVVISTPDHLHAPIAIAAMQKGLHVYIEKPLAHNIAEVRRIEAVAREKKVVAWMGNQHHVSAGYRRAVELLEGGTIGTISEIHAWTSKPTWVQGVARPEERSTAPSNVNWDLWLGPAPLRGYHPIYHPVGWRGWWDFGGGALADMGTHLLDPVFSGLRLGAPTTVSAKVSDKGNRETAPPWSTVEFEFPENGRRPAVKLTWYDGGLTPPKELFAVGRPVPRNGVLCVGELGKLYIPDLGKTPVLLPKVRGESLAEPEQKLALTRGHQQDWLEACRQKKPNTALFTEACRLTEVCLVGNIAVRLKKTLKWDTAAGKFDDEEANKLLSRTYREGWELG